MTNIERIGIIAGEGLLPVELALIQLQQKSYVAIASLYADADINNNQEIVNNPSSVIKNFYIGQVGAILDFFKSHNVTNIVMAGKVHRPDFKDIKVDLKGSSLIAKLASNKLFGDDTIMQSVSNFIEDNGFTVISPLDIISNSDLYKNYNNIGAISNNMDKDIETASNILDDIAKYDIGQSIVINNGRVIGIEGAEGTDELINRCAMLCLPGQNIFVKKSKTCQDMRLDLPTIGLNTIQNLVKHQYSGIAIERGKVLIVSPLQVFEAIQNNNLFLKFIE